MTRHRYTYDRGLCRSVSYNTYHLASLAQQMKTSTTLGVDVVPIPWCEKELNPYGAYEEFHYFILGADHM